DLTVTGVQTCALPICVVPADAEGGGEPRRRGHVDVPRPRVQGPDVRTGHGPGRVYVRQRARSVEVLLVPVRGRQARRQATAQARSEERRVGKECRYRW